MGMFEKIYGKKKNTSSKCKSSPSMTKKWQKAQNEMGVETIGKKKKSKKY